MTQVYLYSKIEQDTIVPLTTGTLANDAIASECKMQNAKSYTLKLINQQVQSKHKDKSNKV